MTTSRTTRRLRSSLARASVAVLLLLASFSTSRGADRAVHPADGADADLRIRIGERVVTWQITLNLAFLDEILPITREDFYALHPLEYDALQASMVEVLNLNDSVRIDGVEVTPRVKSFSVEDADLSLLPLFPNMGTRALIKASVVFEYAVLQSPREVAFHWSSYPPDSVMANVMETLPPMEVKARLAVAGEEREITFKQSEPEFVWHGEVPTMDQRFLAVPSATPGSARTIPALSIGLAALAVLSGLVLRFSRRWARVRGWVMLGVPAALVVATLCTSVGRLPLPRALQREDSLPSEARASEIFQPLHTNIYRAFEYEDPAEIYDALSRSVEGTLLDQLYHEIYQGLILQEEGGAVCRVESVTPIETKVESVGRLDGSERAAFTVDARWRVQGVVHHFGHSHSRVNEYRARYTAAETDGVWRIHSSETLEQFRVSATPLENGAESGAPPATATKRPANEI